MLRPAHNAFARIVRPQHCAKMISWDIFRNRRSLLPAGLIILANIAISALHIRSNYNPSQEVYVSGILNGMRGRIPGGMRISVLVTPENRGLFTLDGFDVIECPFIPSVSRRIAWEQIDVPKILRRHGIGLYHDTGNNALLRYGGRQAITVHYTPDYETANLKSRVHLAYRKWIMGRSIRKADAVICASSYLKNGLLDIFDRDNTLSGKFRIVPMGVDTDVYNTQKSGSQNDPEILKRYGVSEPYFFAYACILCLKNEARIFHAWAALRRSLPERIGLVLMGDPASRHTHERELERLGALRGDVTFTGFVPRGDLAALYRRAVAFVYPSLVESFGLCVLEAMACGTPVLTSNVTAMPEVAGGAAILVDPYSETEIENGMKLLARNDSERARLAAAGLNRAAEMSWNATAAKTLEVYSSLLSSAGAGD